MSTPTSASSAAALGDGFAIGLSSLCLVHCLALPLAASLLPVAGAWPGLAAEAEWVHMALLLVAAPVSLWTLAVSAGRSWPVLGVAAAGLALLAAGALEFPSHAWETPVTVAGGLVLAGAHVLNWRRRGVRCAVGHD